MRFIKTFDSLIVESVKSDLKEFCEINLAYLMDDDYKVMITRRDSLPADSRYHKKGLIIHFYKWPGSRVGFKWIEIEDHFIPFIKRLSNEYTVVECNIDYGTFLGKTDLHSSGTKYVVPMEDLLKGDLPKRSIDRILIIVGEE